LTVDSTVAELPLTVAWDPPTAGGSPEVAVKLLSLL
jgi:hypothetical protein